jgi:hypothetical protein
MKRWIAAITSPEINRRNQKDVARQSRKKPQKGDFVPREAEPLPIEADDDQHSLRKVTLFLTGYLAIPLEVAVLGSQVGQ